MRIAAGTFEHQPVRCITDADAVTSDMGRAPRGQFRVAALCRIVTEETTMSEQKQQQQQEPNKVTELEEQDLDKAVGGARQVGRRPRTSCPCDGSE